MKFKLTYMVLAVNGLGQLYFATKNKRVHAHTHTNIEFRYSYL